MSIDPETGTPMANPPDSGETMCDCGKHVEGDEFALPAGGHVRAAHDRKPDSGERCNATLGEDRVVYQCSRPKGHTGQHRDGNVTAWDQKPDSGEREVLCPICERPLCRTTLGDSADHEQRARCYRRGFARLQDELAWRADEVRVPLPLAQRILAALETGMAGSIGEAQKQIALARELRAAVERKP